MGRKRREGNKVQEDKCPYQGGAQPNPTSTHLGGGAHPKLKVNEVSSIGAIVGVGFQLCRLVIRTHMLHTLGFVKKLLRC